MDGLKERLSDLVYDLYIASIDARLSSQESDVIYKASLLCDRAEKMLDKINEKQ